MKFKNLTRLFLLVPVLALVSFGPVAMAVNATLLVKPSQMDGWSFQVGHLLSGTGTAAGSFQIGPSSPPLGAGSVLLTSGSDGDSFVQIRNRDYAGTLLSNITALSYDTFVSANSGCVAPYIALNVDVNGDGVFDFNSSPDDVLFFEPCYQTVVPAPYPTFPPNQTIPPQNGGIIVNGTWQHWDAFIGGWWSAKYGGNGGPPLTLLSTYIFTTLAGYTPRLVNASTPSLPSECLGGLRIIGGGGAPVWDNFIGNADNVTIGVSGDNTTYDFECESDGFCPPPPTCPAPPEGCTATIGFFKTHAGFTGHNPDVITSLLPLMLGSGGGKTITVSTASQAVSLLSFKGSNGVFDASNGINKLYAQLLAAKLNIAAGANGVAVFGTISAADAFLATKNSTDWVSLTKAQKQMVLNWMSRLDSYNNGVIGPGHCDQ